MISEGLLDCELKGLKLRQCAQNKSNRFYKRHVDKEEVKRKLT